MIGVIDYGMGNLRSVLNALEYLGFDAALVDEPGSLGECERVILPGVGAFAQAMENLHARGLEPAIREHVAAEKPFLGICLGMEVLATTGDEGYVCDGLNLIPGIVTRLPVKQGTALPHVGWNSLKLTRDHPLFAGVRRDVDFYFVHSYGFQAPSGDSSSVLAMTEYDASFPSAIAKGSVVGLQFHPEKSQVAGLKILERFCQWDGVC